MSEKRGTATPASSRRRARGTTSAARATVNASSRRVGGALPVPDDHAVDAGRTGGADPPGAGAGAPPDTDSTTLAADSAAAVRGDVTRLETAMEAGAGA